MLTKVSKGRIIRYNGLALGMFQSVTFPSTCDEYHIRNGYSRLYYAFFHASLAFLISREVDIETIRKDHGKVHRAIDKHLGKSMGKFFRELYFGRQQADYEPDLFVTKYRGHLDGARLEASSLMSRARAHFNWLQQESKKVL